MNKTFKIVVCIYFSFSILQSCSVNKGISDSKEIELSNNELINKINSFKETDGLILLKGSKITIDDNSVLTNLKANILIKRDSAILISISTLLGIEVSRALILKDSIKVIDRINKTYYIKKYDELEARFSISLDFLQLQSVLTGDFKNIIQNSSSSLDKSYTSEKGKFKISISEPNLSNETVETSFQIDALNLLVNTVTILFIKENQQYLVYYGDYIETNNYFYPGFIEIEMKNKKAPVKIAIQNKSIKIEPNKKLMLDIPESYLQSR